MKKDYVAFQKIEKLTGQGTLGFGELLKILKEER